MWFVTLIGWHFILGGKYICTSYSQKTHVKKSWSRTINLENMKDNTKCWGEKYEGTFLKKV